MKRLTAFGYPDDNGSGMQGDNLLMEFHQGDQGLLLCQSHKSPGLSRVLGHLCLKVGLVQALRDLDVGLAYSPFSSFFLLTILV